MSQLVAFVLVLVLGMRAIGCRWCDNKRNDLSSSPPTLWFGLPWPG